MEPKDSSSKQKPFAHKAEAIFLSVICFAVGALCFVFAPWKTSPASYAVVSVMGKEIYSLSLSQDKEIDVDTSHGQAHLCVRGGGIAVTSSPCRSQYCVHQGYKYNAGDSIICAPLGLSVYLYSTAEVTEISV